MSIDRVDGQWARFVRELDSRPVLGKLKHSLNLDTKNVSAL